MYIYIYIYINQLISLKTPPNSTWWVSKRNASSYATTTGSRSNNRRGSVKQGVLKKFQKFHRKTPVLKYLFNKAAGLQVCNFNKMRHSGVFL